MLPFISLTGSDSYRYLGCFKDGDNDSTKVLSKRGSYRPHTDTTKCMEYCLEDSLFYFGIALKYMCYCGNASSNYSRFGPASTPGSDCLDANYNNIEIYEGMKGTLIVVWHKVLREYINNLIVM